MKIVLDTNVLVAALIANGVCADLVEHCILSHKVEVSIAILGELHEQLMVKFKYTSLEADEAIILFRSQMGLVSPAMLDQQVCRDPDDDVILGTALAANADCIVTGDKDLLVLQQFQGIDIVRPGDFADYETKRNQLEP